MHPNRQNTVYTPELSNYMQRFDIEPPPFQKTNTLLGRDSPPSHKIINITKKQQNIQLVFIILNKQPEIRTKRDTIVQCLVADQTACMLMNFFNQTAAMIQEGDIIYASGVYSSLFKQMLLLYQGSLSIMKRVGRNFFRFNTTINMSQQSLQLQKVDNQTSTNLRKF